MRVIVVGAGLAGLAAAQDLRGAGVDVQVLEARERVGGRCHTVEGIDLGAHWIHGTEGNPVTSLARHFHLPTVFVGGDSTYTGGWDAIALRGRGGVTIAGDDKAASGLAADAMWDGLEQLRRQRLEAALPDISVADAVEQLRAGGRLPADETLRWHLEMLAREDAGSGSQNLSLQWWDEDVDVFGYGDSVLVDGYGTLAARLADGLTIRCDAAVTRIDLTDPGTVRVTLRDDETALADAVLCTLPLGVLKAGSVTFAPLLPDVKRAAIERLGIGVLAKVALMFDDMWWPEDQYVVGLVDASAQERPTVIVNASFTHGAPVLVLLAGGDLGRWVETAHDATVREWALAVLADAFGRGHPQPLALVRTSWSRDEHSLGSYSALTVGSTVDDLDVLAEPVGERLFFAGEATSRRGRATAHGALSSGRREAARILGRPPPSEEGMFGETRRLRRQRQRTARFYASVTSGVGGDVLAARVALLHASEAFADLAPRDLDALASMFEERLLGPGEVLCRAGDEASEVYVVAHGSLSVQEAAVGSVMPLERGAVAGELGLFGEGRRAATLVASDDASVLCLDYERFRRYLLAFPEASLTLLGAAIARLTGERAVPTGPCTTSKVVEETSEGLRKVVEVE